MKNLNPQGIVLPLKPSLPRLQHEIIKKYWATLQTDFITKLGPFWGQTFRLVYTGNFLHGSNASLSSRFGRDLSFAEVQQKLNLGEQQKLHQKPPV